jgi:signal-transduction protein with cAMP-binding, CBS, and nucleotidyltransferase domain
MAVRVDQLKAIPLFSGLAPADLQFLAGEIDEVSIPAGTVLITEGVGNQALFVILEGVVDVSVRGKYRRTLGPHDFFGEISA